MKSGDTKKFLLTALTSQVDTLDIVESFLSDPRTPNVSPQLASPGPQERAHLTLEDQVFGPSGKKRERQTRLSQ